MFRAYNARRLTLISQGKNIKKATKLTIKDIVSKIKDSAKAGEHNLEYDLPEELKTRIDVTEVERTIGDLGYHYYYLDNYKKEVMYIWW